MTRNLAKGRKFIVSKLRRGMRTVLYNDRISSVLILFLSLVGQLLRVLRQEYTRNEHTSCTHVISAINGRDRPSTDLSMVRVLDHASRNIGREFDWSSRRTPFPDFIDPLQPYTIQLPVCCTNASYCNRMPLEVIQDC